MTRGTGPCLVPIVQRVGIRLPHPAPHASAGFTLIEILVALVLTGLVVAAVTQSLSLAMRARESQTRVVARRDEMDAVEHTLRSMIERLDPGGVNGRPGMFSGEARRLSFTSTLPLAASGQITRLVDATVTVDPGRRLILSWTPHLPNLILPDAVRGQSVLLDDVERIEFGYWQPVPGPAGGVWLAHWAGAAPPSLIRIRIVPGAANGRRFPDIVVRPERTRWRA